MLSTLDSIHDVNEAEVKNETASFIQESLDPIYEESGRWDWLHDHRKNIHFRFSNARSTVVDSLIGLAEVVEDYATLADYFDATIQTEEDPLYTVFTDITGISRFGRLSAFNFLEICDTAIGNELPTQ